MWKVAHRGYSGMAPENTMASFRAALAEGADGVEFDVHLSAEGVPVILHDADLARTTNGHGEVQSHTVAQLQTLDAGSWFAAEFADERIPTLHQALELFHGKTTPYIELKSAGAAEPTVALLRELGMIEQVVIMSFDEVLLEQVKAADTHIRRRLLLGADGSANPEESWRQAATRTGMTHLSIDHAALTPQRVAWLHAMGYHVVAWTVNDAARMRELIAMGIEGIITNEIGALRRIA